MLDRATLILARDHFRKLGDESLVFASMADAFDGMLAAQLAAADSSPPADPVRDANGETVRDHVANALQIARSDLPAYTSWNAIAHRLGCALALLDGRPLALGDSPADARR